MMRRRSMLLLAPALTLVVACGSDEVSSEAAPSSPSASSEATSPSASPLAPLVVPKDCRPDGAAIELAVKHTSWIGPDGRQAAPGTLCLAVPEGPFTVTVDDRGDLNHNFAVYTDRSTQETVFRGDDLVFGGERVTYHVAAVPSGAYYFQCDLHPDEMNGVLVVT